MIVSLILLIPLLVVSLLAFFKLMPQNADPEKLKTYNVSTIVIAIVGSLGYASKIRVSMINGADAQWWPIIAALFAPFVLIGTLFISGLIRNFIVFKKK